jgi:hypothetical protein
MCVVPRGRARRIYQYRAPFGAARVCWRELRGAVDVAADTAIKAALNGAGAADLAARFAAARLESHALVFLVGEVCRGAYVQVPFTASASIGAAPAIHGFAAPLWSAASGCPGPPSS